MFRIKFISFELKLIKNAMIFKCKGKGNAIYVVFLYHFCSFSWPIFQIVLILLISMLVFLLAGHIFLTSIGHRHKARRAPLVLLYKQAPAVFSAGSFQETSTMKFSAGKILTWNFTLITYRVWSNFCFQYKRNSY